MRLCTIEDKTAVVVASSYHRNLVRFEAVVQEDAKCPGDHHLLERVTGGGRDF